MPDEDKNFGGSLVSDFRKRRRHYRQVKSRTGSTRNADLNKNSTNCCMPRY